MVHIEFDISGLNYLLDLLIKTYPHFQNFESRVDLNIMGETFLGSIAI